MKQLGELYGAVDQRDKEKFSAFNFNPIGTL
jgi:hypothetical protein